MEKVAIYARISTDNLGQDVDRQLHEVRDYCQRMGYEIAEEYVDETCIYDWKNHCSGESE